MLSFTRISVVTFIAAVISLTSNAKAPAGFDDPGLIASLKAGKIAQKDLLSTSKELKVLYRSYFKGVSAEDYAKKTEQHDDYEKFFSAIKGAKRLTKYAAGRRYE